jgi:catechol 2,3-dioxygenase-like lactoylglutathione lyase family enzyme
MPADAGQVAAKFHLSLNVTDLGRAVAFYRVLFGAEPAKSHADYAKFDLDDPPVVFSLVPRSPGPGDSLRHTGLRVPDRDALQRVRTRLEAAGVRTQDQNEAADGQARPDRVWTRDPDGNSWEVSVADEELDPRGVQPNQEGPADRAEPSPVAVAWEHYVTHPAPERIPHADGTLDEVRLTGTFNADLDEAARARLVREAARVLKPGGKVVTHGLVADKPFPNGSPKLPGLATLVSRVPVQDEPVRALLAAGFVAVQAVKYTERPWFIHDGVELREAKLIAWKPGAGAGDGPREVLYRGPFAEAVVDGGWVFPRGRRVAVSPAVWQQLRLGASAEQFLFFEPGPGCGCTGT